jgi:hypothetical protein
MYKGIWIKQKLVFVGKLEFPRIHSDTTVINEVAMKWMGGIRIYQKMVCVSPCSTAFLSRDPDYANGFVL